MITTNALLTIGAAEIVVDGTGLTITSADGEFFRGHWRANTLVGIPLAPADRWKVEQAVLRVITRRAEKATAKADKNRNRQIGKKGPNRW